MQFVVDHAERLLRVIHVEQRTDLHEAPRPGHLAVDRAPKWLCLDLS